MPALVLFNRRTILGGDDIQPTCIVTIVVRLIQILFLCIPILHYTIMKLIHSNEDSTDSTFLFSEAHFRNTTAAGTDRSDASLSSYGTVGTLRTFYVWISIWTIVSTLYNIISILIERQVLYWSNFGTPTTEVQMRSYHLQLLLHFKLFTWTIILFLIWMVGIIGVFGYFLVPHFSRSSTNSLLDTTATSMQRTVIVSTNFGSGSQMLQKQVYLLAIIVMLSSQMMEIFVSAMFTFRLYQIQPIDETASLSSFVSLPADADELGSLPEDINAHYNHELVEEMWADRCETTCHCLSVSTCYMFGGRNLSNQSTAGTSMMQGASVFSDVARALADFLESRGVLNIVPSDIVAGLIILQRIQHQRIYAARQKYIASSTLIHRLERIESGIIEADDNVAQSTALNRNGNSTIRKRSKNSVCNQQEDGLIRISSMSRASSTDDMLVSLPQEDIAATPLSSAAVVNCNHRDADPMGNTRSTKESAEGLHSVYRIDPNGGYQREERALLDRNNFTELYLLEEAARYAKYALAMYSWVLYLYEHPITGPFRLLGQSSSHLCDFCKMTSNSHQYEQPTHFLQESTATSSVSLVTSNDSIGHIDGDNICQTHKNAILLTAGLSEDDLVYVQLRSSLSEIPYCILLDHCWKSVIVSIRGTFSIEDCITDVLISPESLAQLGSEFGFEAVDQYCHGGVMSSARNVYRDLERHGLLDGLLFGEHARYPSYTLRLVGHSLGAATCTLLSYMLRTKFPNLRCINYSPPGCTFTWEMATQCKDWCTTCVLDTDIVPRLSVESIECLRDEILDLVGRIRVPKSVVAQRFTENSFRLCADHEDCSKNFIDDSDLIEILYDIDKVPDSEYQQQLVRFKEIQEERRQQRGTRRSIKLYPPGRILHIVKTGEKRSCSAGLAKVLTCCTSNVGATYVPVWIDNNDLNEIVVGPRMATDHFPNRIRSILEIVARDVTCLHGG
jgi:sn1-specific diacylglycerol lipase